MFGSREHRGPRPATVERLRALKNKSRGTSLRPRPGEAEEGRRGPGEQRRRHHLRTCPLLRFVCGDPA